MKTKSKDKKRTQYGALPYRVGPEGGAEVVLITSRESRRWILPKGWPMKGFTPSRTAEREAFEEGGLIGEVGKAPVGRYSYLKRLKSGATVPCEVVVFPLQVSEQRDHWPEATEREVRWFSMQEAVETVDEKALAELIRSFAATVPSAPAA